MMLTTGPLGYIVVTTPAGRYSVPETWAERRMPTLLELAQFLAGKGESVGFLEGLLNAMNLATGEDREALAAAFPRVWFALCAWQTCVPLVPVRDAHGPTMRQLAERINLSEGDRG
jgi:hypothetical protein